MALDIPEHSAVRVELMRAAHESVNSNSKIDIELGHSSTRSIDTELTHSSTGNDPVFEARQRAAREVARADRLEAQAARLLGEPSTDDEIIAALDERYSK